MSSSIKGRDIVPWQAAYYEGDEAVDAGARYFTQRKFVPGEHGKPFATGVDPNGLLAAIRGQDLIHGEDNKVDYLKEYTNVKGITK